MRCDGDSQMWTDRVGFLRPRRGETFFSSSFPPSFLPPLLLLPHLLPLCDHNNNFKLQRLKIDFFFFFFFFIPTSFACVLPYSSRTQPPVMSQRGNQVIKKNQQQGQQQRTIKSAKNDSKHTTRKFVFSVQSINQHLLTLQWALCDITPHSFPGLKDDAS